MVSVVLKIPVVYMCLRASILVLFSMLTVTFGIAQQTETSTQDLQLNLEQFPNAQSTPAKEELELNLEQFEKTENSGNPDADEDLELNLEQFDNSGESSANSNITSGDSGATRIEKSDAPQYNYRRILLVGGVVFLVFLYFLSRRRKSRR